MSFAMAAFVLLTASPHREGEDQRTLDAAHACRKDCAELQQRAKKITDAEEKVSHLGFDQVLGLYQKAGDVPLSVVRARLAELWAGGAVTYDPALTSAQAAFVREQRSKMKDLFMRAYALREADPDAALGLFKQIVKMGPRDDETVQKALRHLDKAKP